MKKSILILFVAFLAASSAKAQDAIYGGLRLAPNYSFFTDDVQNVNSGIGYGFGYFEVLEMTNKINLQAEINWNTISFVEKVTAGSVTTTTTTRHSKIELPIMVKYRLSGNFAVGAGYQFNLNPGRAGREITKTGSTTSKSPAESISTSGIFVDASVKGGSNIFGLRVLYPNKEQYLGNQSLNVAFYMGITIFK